MIHLKNCMYLVAWTNFMVSADKWSFSGVIHLIILNWMDEVSETDSTLKVPVSLSFLESGATSLNQPQELHIVDYGDLKLLVSLPAVLVQYKPSSCT